MRYLLDRRGLDVHLHPSRDALAEVGVEVLLHCREDLLGTAEQQPVERQSLEAAEGDLGCPLEVVVHLLLHAPLISGLGPAPLVVLPVHLVLDGWELDQPVRRTAQHPSGLAVDEQQRPAPPHAELGERLDQRRVVDHRTGSDRARQLDRLEQLDRAAGKEGEPVRVLASRLALRRRALVQLLAQVVRLLGPALVLLALVLGRRLRSPFALVRLALKLVEPQLLGGGIRFSLRHRLRPYCVQVCWYSSCVSGAARSGRAVRSDRRWRLRAPRRAGRRASPPRSRSLTGAAAARRGCGWPPGPRRGSARPRRG